MVEVLSSAVLAQEGYTNWAAIAGFFDGDGSVDIDVRAHTIHWVLSFTDNWLRQIEQIKDFLVNHGIRVGKVRKAGVGGWVCEIKEISSLKALAMKMLQSGGIYKKKRELKLLVDYYSDKVTGTEVIEAFNSEVRLGIRVGKIRNMELLYTHSEGLWQARHASRFERRILNVIETRNLIDEYLTKGVTAKSLARKYDVSETTVSRVLKREGIDTKTRERIPINSDSGRKG